MRLAIRRRRVSLLDLRPPPARLYDDVVRGLSRSPRMLPPKYFYDCAGAALFEQITELPEYYPTRTELGILEGNISDIARGVGPGARIVEFGSGSGAKTRIVLRHVAAPAAYVPIDIALTQLMQFASSVAEEFPHIEVLPVCADYTHEVALPRSAREPARTVAFFPGSTIGNFEQPQALSFLRNVRALCGDGGGLLIGADLHKDAQVLHDAYNDADGITAAFNLNLLERINRECGADFDIDSFRHLAVYDEDAYRIEMRLIAERDMLVTLPPQRGRDAVAFRFERGEYIVTEYSHKYTLDGFRELTERTGWTVEHVWTDEREWFGVWLLRA